MESRVNKKPAAAKLSSHNGYTVGEKITIHFDYYECWKSKGYHSYKQMKGSESGMKKQGTSKEAEVMAIIEKAVQIVYYTFTEKMLSPHRIWIPFSQLSREDSVVTVSGKFCYNNQDRFNN